MGGVDDHAHPVHLGHHVPPEGGQADVRPVASAPGGVVAVVGEQHLAHAEAVVEGDHRQVVVEGVHAFEVEGDAEHAGRLCAQHVVHGLDQQVAVRAQGDPPAEVGQRPDRRLPRHDVVARR